MKHLLALAFAFLLPVAALAADTNQEEQHKATEDAKAWLALVDAGNYDQAWSDAAGRLRKTDKADWIASTKTMREALGALVRRHPSGVVMTKSVAGLSSGDYALVFFTTAYEKNPEATEKLTMVMDGGTWRTVTYTAK